MNIIPVNAMWEDGEWYDEDGNPIYEESAPVSHDEELRIMHDARTNPTYDFERAFFTGELESIKKRLANESKSS